MLFALAGLCLALIVVIPVCLLVVLDNVQKMHQRTMDLIQDTQLVQGTPARLVEQKQESVREQVREQAARRVANMPQLSDTVRI